MGKLKTLHTQANASSVLAIGGDGGVGGGIAPTARLPLSEFFKLLRTGAVTAVTYFADRPPAGALLVKAALPAALAAASPVMTPFGTAPMVAVPTRSNTAETLLLPGCHQALFEELRAHEGVRFECAEVSPTEHMSDMGALSLIVDIGSVLASVAALAYLIKSSNQGLFSGRHLEEAAPTHRSTVTFEDVAGMEKTKEELREVIAFLRNPGSFYALGARPPRGILLAGPSGTGKTLLARAVAGEAGVPFLYASSAAFVEIFVGQGAQRIRQFFEQARSCAPCIVFLDELDAVGASRQASAPGGNQEYAQTLNQLLLELDGVESHAQAGGGTHGGGLSPEGPAIAPLEYSATAVL